MTSNRRAESNLIKMAQILHSTPARPKVSIPCSWGNHVTGIPSSPWNPRLDKPRLGLRSPNVERNKNVARTTHAHFRPVSPGVPPASAPARRRSGQTWFGWWGCPTRACQLSVWIRKKRQKWLKEWKRNVIWWDNTRSNRRLVKCVQLRIGV